MEIRPFGVEMWMNEFETKCELNLAETCVESITLGELFEMAGQHNSILGDLSALKMTYGAIEGSERLRHAICGLYEHQTRDNILTTHGTIGANSLVHQTLVSRGDHVISVIPTYQQHYSIPESIGADIELLHLLPQNGFLPDLNVLRDMVRPGTRLIAINNPNNPTGALMDRAMLEQIVEVARSVDAWILCDEVYRGTDQTGDGFTAAVADLYEKGISTAGMSKAYSLAGLRVGWIAGSKDLLHDVMFHRDYNTISVGQVDELLAAMALENRDQILERARRITRENLRIVEDWISDEPLLSWVPPKSGTTALLKYDLPMSSRDLCVALLKEEGVMLTPGSAMDMEGWLRLGYTNPTADLKAGLKRLSGFLARHNANLEVSR
ncbi:aminotransferase [Ruegeria sp. ANG-S4]|uniref:aminotransferase n=1 Tax=Ruegeria sp. ANG-S4 TaxID=1577904 RepID=UPI00057D2A7D|nr:aminotransferase [Ruegeria sp. ANG-S4]KIC45031.1 aminotransferase [Ruegeria sp. ANG-S4]